MIKRMYWRITIQTCDTIVLILRYLAMKGYTMPYYRPLCKSLNDKSITTGTKYIRSIMSFKN